MNEMIETLLNLYRQQFPFDRFYDNLLYNISAYPKYHIASQNFLAGYRPKTKIAEDIPLILTKSGDIRVDLPIWFGDPCAKNKIVVVGLEPRDTDKSGHLNIERVENFVFGTPFALEHPKGPYYSAFREVTEASDTFFYFTDVVKTYQVGDSCSKSTDDKIARQTFWKKAHEGKAFLLEELQIIEPDNIVALGNDSFSFLNELLGATYNVRKVRHPSQGGARIARQQLAALLQSLS